MSGRDQGKHIPYGPNMLEPLSALLPASTLQSVHSTQKTRSSSHTPEHPFYTEDVVQLPHSRASVLHRRRGPAPTLQSVHSTQKTWSSALTPERPLYTEDVVQCPHSRASTLHRRRGPEPTLQSIRSTQRTWSSPGAFWVSSFLSCTGAAHTCFPQPPLALLPAQV